MSVGWEVLGLDGDPAPGDPCRTRDLAARLLGEAELAEHNTARLRSVAANGGDLRMEGDYALKFRDVLDGLPDELAKLGRAYRGVGEAVSGFAADLEHAKSQAGSALRQGRDAEAQYQGAVRQVQALLPPDRAATVVSGPRLEESLLEAAMADLDEGRKIEVRAAARRARFAEQDRDRAARLASDAARLRGEAETRCVQGIHSALDGSGIKNKSWLAKAWDVVSAPCRSWDDFVDLCAGVAMVVGAAVMFLVGSLGWGLLAAAVVGGGLTVVLTGYAQGKVPLGALGLAVLGLLPGGRGVVSMATLGSAVRGLAQGLARGTLIGAALRIVLGHTARGRGIALTGAPATRRSLDEILERYQVSTDPDGMVTYPGSLEGWALEKFGLKQLTITGSSKLTGMRSQRITFRGCRLLLSVAVEGCTPRSGPVLHHRRHPPLTGPHHHCPSPRE